MNNTIKIILTLISISLFLNCGTNQTAGNSMETENSISLLVLDSNQVPVEQALISIRPIWYLHFPDSNLSLPDSLTDRATDKNGIFHLPNLKDGDYLIFIRHQGSASTLSYTASQLEFEGDSLSKNFSTQLSAIAKIKGRVPLPEGIKSAWVQVFGLDLSTQTDSLGYYELDSLPSGELKISAWAPQSNELIGEQSLYLKPGRITVADPIWNQDNLLLDTLAWRYRGEVQSEDYISDWMRPLSLPSVITLKLSKDIISQTPTPPTSGGLRVFNKKGKALISQVRHWDDNNEYAFLRVRVDSPEDTSGLWTLRWGRQHNLTDESNLLWKDINDSLKNFLTALPWENFEDSNNLADIETSTPTSFWYFGPSDTSVTITPAPYLGLTAALQPAGQGRTGQAVHLTYSSTKPSWILLGSKMGEGRHSLVTLDSIVLWMRGNGEFSVGFDKLDSLDVGVKAWMHGPLDSTWTRYSIRPEDFLDPDGLGDNAGWLAVRDSVTNFSLFAANGTEFWVDDIVFYGINRDNIEEP